MAHIPGPDFPTAAIINGRRGIEEAYRTGRGKSVHPRWRAMEVDAKSARETIIVHRKFPYQVNKARLIEKIARLVKKNAWKHQARCVTSLIRRDAHRDW